MIIGCVFLGLAYFFWVTPIIFNVIPPHTQDKINLAYSDNIVIAEVELNFITYTTPQKINIHYSLLHKENKTGFVALDLPYTGFLDDTTSNWKIEKFPNTNSSVIYKNYTCTSQKSCVFDSGDVSFTVKDSLDSIKSFHHYIQVPFSTGPENSKIVDFYNKLAKIPSFQQGWTIQGLPHLNIYLDKDDDQWNTQPHSDLDSFKRSNGDVHVILVWPISKSNIIVAADYTNEKDRFIANASPVLFGAFVGVGIAMLIANVHIKRQEDDKKFLKNSIDKTENRIKGTLGEIKEIVDKEHLDKKIKTEQENRIYKISLLHDLSGIIMAIYQTVHYFKTRGEQDIENLQKVIKSNSETFQYWADRITSINSNTYVPADIRSTVSMFLHQGIKPISWPDSALDYNFLQTTVLNDLDRILDSDYMKNDQDPSVKHYLQIANNSRNFLLKLK
jgi:hypothetical protein